MFAVVVTFVAVAILLQLFSLMFPSAGTTVVLAAVIVATCNCNRAINLKG